MGIFTQLITSCSVFYVLYATLRIICFSHIVTFLTRRFELKLIFIIIYLFQLEPFAHQYCTQSSKFKHMHDTQNAKSVCFREFKLIYI